ncbi:hypothetical protein GDO86_009427 [Hymenochirus boettgeri]|uniref:Uncharacterized protein n=1 Tax=Hymenochirus boettgeri TaxID=247094 RepID=A0A8T2JL36_9PIPI|nr:hypothetical protein GDO86_009427 [Hymenochirus boettgeri]
MAEEDRSVTSQLDSVLSMLYDFGDDDLPCKKKKKQNVRTSEQSQTVSSSKENDKVNKGLKETTDTPETCSRKHCTSLFFETLKEELSGQTKPTDLSSLATQSSENSEHSFKVVTFSTRKKIKVHAEPDRSTKTDLKNAESETRQLFNFERARLEIHKFGITGFKKEKQRMFEQERAIMLGAKPPKREYVNYKAYQEKLKEIQTSKQKEKKMKTQNIQVFWENCPNRPDW